jgi:NADH-quinone oxidoreductase subunit G
MDTVTLTIDGQSITVPKGRTVLQAAIEAGLKVPYYCYHPALGVDGSCRVCLVKIEKMPKLQVSCSVPVADGMVVYTQTPDVVTARAGVFEFLLLNHPLDCPVCDKGGECPLQDFSYSFGPDGSRMEFPRRVFDGEGVKADVDFGPTLMLNRNRCILCTRCVRFMKDIDGDAQINIIDRGYGSEIATFEERGVHSLLSGNLMDVCPVGAITTRDYRFKSRPWDNPGATDTICTLCEKGCNTTAWLRAKPEWAKGAQVVRVTPRLNPDVNGYFMCDIGRFDYRWVEGDQRLRRPMVKAGDAQQPVTWKEALSAVQELLQNQKSTLRCLSSAHASHEELWLLRRLAESVAGSREAVWVTWTSSVKPQPPNTQWRVPAINAPNVPGARALGVVPSTAPDLSALRADVAAGRATALYVFDPGPAGSLADVTWIIDARKSGQLKALVVQGVLATDLARQADVVLPGAAFLEKEAAYSTLVNGQPRLQTTARVISPPGEALEDWTVLTRVSEALGSPLAFSSLADVRKNLAESLGSDPTVAGIQELRAGPVDTARHWLEASNPMERWKWDAMFQDEAPVKYADAQEPQSTPGVIPLRRLD